MIERKMVEQRMKEFKIQEYISENLRNSGHSHTKVQRTPMGEKIVVYTSRPGMIVGRKGQNIKKLTSVLKKEYHLENPQVEIAEVENINLDAQIVAERVAMSLERFGSARFKGVAHKALSDVMGANALGVELTISGKVPSMRARTWRFFNGYLKKCGDIAISGVNHAYATARLKSGVIGIQVKIMPSTTKLPDDIKILSEEEKNKIHEEVKEGVENKKEKKEEKKVEKTSKKKITKNVPKKEKAEAVKSVEKAEVLVGSAAGPGKAEPVKEEVKESTEVKAKSKENKE